MLSNKCSLIEKVNLNVFYQLKEVKYKKKTITGLYQEKYLDKRRTFKIFKDYLCTVVKYISL